MFKDNRNRVCALVVAEFEPKVSHLGRRNSALDAAQHHMQSAIWQLSAGRAVLQSIDAQSFFLLDLRQAFFQSLGMNGWSKEQVIGTFTDALRELGVDRITKAVLTTRVFFSTGMLHAEMVDLMPGTYLAPAETLDKVVDNLDDAYVKLNGTYEGCKVALEFAPMNPQDTEASIMATNNLQLFVKNALIDSRVKDFREQMGSDPTLFVQVELSRDNLERGGFSGFVNQALTGAEVMTDRAVRHLKSLRPRR